MVSIFVALMMVAFQNQISQLFFSDPQYGYLVMIASMAVLVGGTNSIISAPTRIQNKKPIFLIMNTISPFDFL